MGFTDVVVIYEVAPGASFFLLSCAYDGSAALVLAFAPLLVYRFKGDCVMEVFLLGVFLVAGCAWEAAFFKLVVGSSLADVLEEDLAGVGW